MKKLIGSKSVYLIGIAVLFTILFISNSCTKDSMVDMVGMGGGSGGPGTNEVWIKGMAFSPSTITIAAGDTITWMNKDGVTHTVTSDSSLFNSGNIGSNRTYRHIFTTAGTYPYHCSIHTSMKAKVVVN